MREELHEARRGKILAAAREVFMAKGFSRATMDLVAKEARVSSATVYAHFEHKQALFDAFITTTLGRYENLFAGVGHVKGDGRTRLMAFARVYFRFMADPELRAAYRIVSAETNLRPDLGAHLYRDAHNLLGARLRRLLETLVAEGELRIDDIGIASRLFEGMIEHVTLTISMLQGDQASPLHESEPYCAEAVRLFMEGYRPGR
ncbi:AcrR family transcriptional regulator [Caulobacter ginsengisoli]|uniref:AcrR family transcriptional regulator n=1 Tax=Caulobacter ginsengisoli TaxID=400775 RepID=A0ABU0IN47_9CAUL|nr:TetR/AcrR family transcriptional regulator [Caulobacter ginsengisoli]MDQ0463384.1 AcrR family transcriptional regulator [Caulobacter ginsengisoli]